MLPFDESQTISGNNGKRIHVTLKVKIEQDFLIQVCGFVKLSNHPGISKLKPVFLLPTTSQQAKPLFLWLRHDLQKSNWTQIRTALQCIDDWWLQCKPILPQKNMKITAFSLFLSKSFAINIAIHNYSISFY